MSLTEDITKMCEENSVIVREIVEVCHLNKLKKPDHMQYKSKHIKKNPTETSLVRNVQEILIGTAIAAVGVIPNLISINLHVVRINQNVIVR